jgi:hypothetical protein
VTDSSYPGTRRPVPSGAGVFLPLLLLTLAFVAWLGFQAFQQVAERRQLAPLLANLEQQEQAAIKLRSSLDAVATATAKLAADGNANAKTIVDELRKRGVTINPSAVKAP